MQLVGAHITGAVLNYHRLGMKRNTYAYGPTRQLAEGCATPQATSVGAPRTYQPWSAGSSSASCRRSSTGCPTIGFAPTTASRAPRARSLRNTPVLVVALFFGLQRSAPFMRALSVDVFVPLLLFWAFISTVWSTNPFETFRQTVA